MMIALWVVALVIYLAFRLWYDSLKKPLTPDEVAHFSAVFQDSVEHGLSTGEVATFRRFMEEDDGKEFVMVNLVKFNPWECICSCTIRLWLPVAIRIAVSI